MNPDESRFIDRGAIGRVRIFVCEAVLNGAVAEAG
jgi:hypothetical protein